jgi:hypothetical protein
MEAGFANVDEFGLRAFTGEHLTNLEDEFHRRP